MNKSEMSHVVVAVFDRKLGEFLPPWFTPNTQIALRQFVATVEAEQAIQSYPEDYYLVLIGDFDSSTSELRDLLPTFLATAQEVIDDDKACFERLMQGGCVEAPIEFTDPASHPTLGAKTHGVFHEPEHEGVPVNTENFSHTALVNGGAPNAD